MWNRLSALFYRGQHHKLQRRTNQPSSVCASSPELRISRYRRSYVMEQFRADFSSYLYTGLIRALVLGGLKSKYVMSPTSSLLFSHPRHSLVLANVAFFVLAYVGCGLSLETAVVRFLISSCVSSCALLSAHTPHSARGLGLSRFWRSFILLQTLVGKPPEPQASLTSPMAGPRGILAAKASPPTWVSACLLRLSRLFSFASPLMSSLVVSSTTKGITLPLGYARQTPLAKRRSSSSTFDSISRNSIVFIQRRARGAGSARSWP